MRPFSLFVSSLLFAAVPTAAVGLADLATVPACGLQCITHSVSASTCSLTNFTCVCTNEPLKEQIIACLSASCKVKEQLQTEKFYVNACGVEGKDRRYLFWHIGVAFGVLGAFSFGLRCVERIFLDANSWWWDDWVITLVVCLQLAICAISIPLANAGLGLDIWNVTFDQISQILFLFYLEEVFYIFSMSFLKVSVLLFYLKVFPKRGFRHAVYILVGLNMVYAMVYGFVVIFQCTPVNGAWLSWDKEYNARCMNQNILGWSTASINIALDLATIALPLPSLAKLKMPLRKKFQIILMFAVGIFVTLVSVIRLRFLILFGASTNPTQDYIEVGYWSIIEISVGVICANMPACRKLFNRVLPDIFGFGIRSSQRSTSGYKSKYGKQNANEENSSQKKLSSALSGHHPSGRQEWIMLSSTAENSSELKLVTVPSSKSDNRSLPTPTLGTPKSEIAKEG